jgi:hypothetical protein
MSPFLFSSLAQLSQDSNMFRTFVTDDEGIQDVSFILGHAWSLWRSDAARKRDHSGSDHRVGPLWPLCMTAEFFNASFCRC